MKTIKLKKGFRNVLCLSLAAMFLTTQASLGFAAEPVSNPSTTQPVVAYASENNNSNPQNIIPAINSPLGALSRVPSIAPSAFSLTQIKALPLGLPKSTGTDAVAEVISPAGTQVYLYQTSRGTQISYTTTDKTGVGIKFSYDSAATAFPETADLAKARKLTLGLQGRAQSVEVSFVDSSGRQGIVVLNGIRSDIEQVYIIDFTQLSLGVDLTRIKQITFTVSEKNQTGSLSVNHYALGSSLGGEYASTLSYFIQNNLWYPIRSVNGLAPAGTGAAAEMVRIPNGGVITYDTKSAWAGGSLRFDDASTQTVETINISLAKELVWSLRSAAGSLNRVKYEIFDAQGRKFEAYAHNITSAEQKFVIFTDALKPFLDLTKIVRFNFIIEGQDVPQRGVLEVKVFTNPPVVSRSNPNYGFIRSSDQRSLYLVHLPTGRQTQLVSIIGNHGVILPPDNKYDVSPDGSVVIYPDSFLRSIVVQNIADPNKKAVFTLEYSLQTIRWLSGGKIVDLLSSIGGLRVDTRTFAPGKPLLAFSPGTGAYIAEQLSETSPTVKVTLRYGGAVTSFQFNFATYLQSLGKIPAALKEIKFTYITSPQSGRRELFLIASFEGVSYKVNLLITNPGQFVPSFVN